jgi:malic enzyme
VAEASLEIKADPANAARYTARGNLVAVVSNGSAVLGLGNIGALASKPVMEGKAVLFKKFANIDCFDLEVDESDPENWPKSYARWSHPSAPSTSKTSRHQTVSSLNEFAGSG